MKRALVVSSSWNAVLWRANSAACIDQVLRQRGFEVRRLDDEAATRDGILAAYDELIAATDADDAAVFYYVGHGDRFVGFDYAAGSVSERDFRYICPSDYDRTTKHEFRGICRFELAVKLAALTARTRNATAIFECCFSGLMSRGEATVPTETLDAHRDRIRTEPRPPGAEPGNPLAVSIAATDQSDQAYGIGTPTAELAALGIVVDGTQLIGDFTLNLARALGENRDRRISWRGLAPVIRGRMVRSRAELEGPTTRVPFSLDMIDDRSIAVRRDPIALEAGALQGVSAGDRYAIVELDGRAVGTMTIDAVDPVESRGSIVWSAGATAMPDGARALPIHVVGPRVPVRVSGVSAALEAAIAAAPELRIAAPDESTAVTLTIDGEHLRVDDAYGTLFVAVATQLPAAVGVLEDFAAAHRLRSFVDSTGPEPAGFDVALGTVTRGVFEPLPRFGAELRAGARVAVRLRNGSPMTRFAHAFNVGVDYAICVLPPYTCIEVPAGVTEYVGVAPEGNLLGLAVQWPPGLPAHPPRVDSLLVILTDERCDLSSLARSRDVVARGDEAPLPPFAAYWREYLLRAV